MAILYGIGSPDFTTLSLNPARLLPVEPMEFSLEGASEKKESTKFKDGKIVKAGSVVSKETYTMKVGIEAVNWMALQFAYGELAGVTASASLPILKYATVPSTSPYEIVDTDITTTTVQVSVTQSGAGTWGRARPLTRNTTTPTSGEFQVTTGSNKLTFNAAQAGAPIAYRTFKTYTNIESIGAESVYTAFSTFTFSGILYMDEELVKVVVPTISRSNIPTLSVVDTTKFELEFDITISGSFRTAFQMYNLSTAPVS